jgi:hypothetical protein
LSQSRAEFLSLLSCEFVGRSKGSQNCVICKAKSQLARPEAKLRIGKSSRWLYNPRTGELDVSEMLKVACCIVANTPC